MILPSLHELFKDDDVGEGDGSDALMSKEASQSAVPSSAASARLFFPFSFFFFLAAKTRGILLSR